MTELEEFGEPADILVIFDIFGASTMIAAALINGSQRVVPIAGADEAIKLGQILGRESVILCGEKNNLPIPDFDMINSPVEFDRMAITGKTVIYLSEEISRVIGLKAASPRILLGNFNNIIALAENTKEFKLVHLLCAGRGETLSFEDAVCAGMLVDLLTRNPHDEKGINDTAVTSRYLYGRHANDILGLLKESARGRKLLKQNRQRDLEYMAQIGRSDIIPQLAEDRTHFVRLL